VIISGDNRGLARDEVGVAIIGGGGGVRDMCWWLIFVVNGIVWL
jgi:hypothetical protein